MAVLQRRSHALVNTQATAKKAAPIRTYNRSNTFFLHPYNDNFVTATPESVRQEHLGRPPTPAGADHDERTAQEHLIEQPLPVAAQAKLYMRLDSLILRKRPKPSLGKGG